MIRLSGITNKANLRNVSPLIITHLQIKKHLVIEWPLVSIAEAVHF